jgi:hypothetical protein
LRHRMKSSSVDIQDHRDKDLLQNELFEPLEKEGWIYTSDNDLFVSFKYMLYVIYIKALLQASTLKSGFSIGEHEKYICYLVVKHLQILDFMKPDTLETLSAHVETLLQK